MKNSLSKKILSIILTVSIVMSACITAFASEKSPEEIQTQKQIIKAGGTYFYYDAEGNIIDNCTDSSKDWVVKTMRKLEATGTENLFNVTMELSVKDADVDISSKEAAVAIVLDKSNSMNRCVECGKSKGSVHTGHAFESRIDAAVESLISFLEDYSKSSNGKFYGNRWISLVVFNKDIYVRDLDSTTEGDQYWINLDNDAALDAVKAAVLSEKKNCTSSTNTHGGTNAAAALLDSNVSGAAISAIPSGNRFGILLTDGQPTSRFDENGNFTNDGNGDISYVIDTWSAQQGCKAIRDTGAGLFSIAYCFDGETINAIHTDEYDSLSAFVQANPVKNIKNYNNNNVYNTVDIFTWLGLNQDGSKNEDYCASTCVYGASAAEELNKALKSILTNVENIGGQPNGVSAAVSKNEVSGTQSTDPYDFVKFINQNAAAEDSDNMVWNLGTADYTEDSANGIKTYTMVYQVRLNTHAVGFEEDHEYSLGDAELSFISAADGQNHSAGFEALSAKGYLGSLELTKTARHNNRALAGAVFRLENQENSALGMAKGLVAVEDTTDSEGKLSFKVGEKEMIPSGLSYVLSEAKAPEDYDINGEFSKTVTVSYGQITGPAETINVEDSLTQTKADAVFKKVWQKPSDDVLSKQPITLTILQKADGSSDEFEAYGTVTISAGGTVSEKSISESVEIGKSDDGNTWTITVKQLPENIPATGGRWAYAISEAELEGYKAEGNGTGSIINTATGTTGVTAKKVWILPASVTEDQKAALSATVQLYKNGSPEGEAVVLDANNDFTYSWNPLNAYDGQGQTISYTVAEISCTEGYREVTANRTNDGTVWTFTNTVYDEKIDTLKFTKTWNDEGSASRPDNITVQLKQNGENYGEAITLEKPENDNTNTWTYEFSNLPRYKFSYEEGSGKLISVEEYVYTVAEISDVEGYSSVSSGMNAINTRTALGEITVNKVWEDEFSDGQPEVEIELLRNGVHYETKTTESYTCSFADLPIYDGNGKSYIYTVKELSSFGGYTKSVSYGAGNNSADFTDGRAIVTVTNTQNVKDDAVSYSITKIWKQPSDVSVPEKLTVKLYQLPEGSTEITAESKLFKTYDVEMKGLTTQATLSENLPKYYYEQLETESEVQTGVSETGEPIMEKLVEYKSVEHEYVYMAAEEDVKGYIASAPVYGDAYAEFTNTVYAVTDISVNKTWKPLVAEYPSAVIGLYRGLTLAEAESAAESVDSWTVDAESHTFTDLPQYDEDGQLYVYTVKENVTGYTPSITRISDYSFSIVNIINQSEEVANATKIWVDGSLGNESRPAVVLEFKQNGSRIALITADGKGNCTVTDSTIEGITASANVNGTVNQWTVEVGKLPKYDEDRQVYSYEFDEILPEDSAYSVSENGNIITNTLKQAEVNLQLTKKWIDPDGSKHAPVSFVLEQNGVEFKRVVLNGSGENAVAPQNAAGEDLSDLTADTWYYRFSGLDKYDEDRNLYTYTIKEVDIPEGYEDATPQDAAANLFINKLLQDKVAVSFTKTWDDSYEGYLQEEKRPEAEHNSIEAAVYRKTANSEEEFICSAEVEADDAGVMTYDFGSGFDKYDATRQPYIYYVREGCRNADNWVAVEENEDIVINGRTYTANYKDSEAERISGEGEKAKKLTEFITEAVNTFEAPTEYYYKVIGNYQTVVSGKVQSMVSDVQLVGITAEEANAAPVSVDSADYAELTEERITDGEKKALAGDYQYVSGILNDGETSTDTTEKVLEQKLEKANTVYTFILNYERVITSYAPDEPYEPKPINKPEDDPETEIPEEEVPLEELPEEEVPLGQLPEDMPEDIDEILDEEIPLADVPFTGDNAFLWAAMSFMSVITLAVLVIGKKEAE